MRSKQLLHLHNRLSELNSHYSHFLFVSEQFSIDNKSKIDNASLAIQPKTTIEAFPENKFNLQFNCQLSELNQKYEATKQFIFGSLFVFAYSQFEVYLKEVYINVAKELEASKSLPDLKNELVFQQLAENLDLDINQEVIQTINYIRLRRNTMIHRDFGESFKGEVADFVKTSGNTLNQYWQNIEPLAIQSLNFEKRELSMFEEREIIDLINIIRRLAERIDYLILSRYENQIKQRVVEKFKAKYKSESWLCHTSEEALKKRRELFKRFSRFDDEIQMDYDNQEIDYLLNSGK